MAWIEQLHFVAGASPGEAPLSFSPGAITVFVGPNNSGKSHVLRQIESMIRAARTVPRVLRTAEFGKIPATDATEYCLDLPGLDSVAEDAKVEVPRHDRGKIASTHHISLHDFKEKIRDGLSIEPHHEGIGRNILIGSTLRLDGEARLDLSKPQPSGPLRQAPENALMTLITDDAARAQIRALTSKHLGGYVVIDPTNLPELQLRFSAREPADSSEELGLHAPAREFHDNARLLIGMGDGYRAFVGIVVALHSRRYKIILIDEPEAFLHPPLARQLGAILANTAVTRSGHVFASTHSPEFLMGCMQSGVPVDVVRLTYDGTVATARLLPSDDVRRMMLNPFMRSTGVITALFSVGAVVCEGNVDRIFYQEVVWRLRTAERIEDDPAFVDAVNGKQNAWQLIGPLRRVGVPAAAIVDLDIVKQNLLAPLLRAAGAPQTIVSRAGELKKALLDEFDQAGLDLKCGGITQLSDEAQAKAGELLTLTATYGVFLVPVGEVEHWLSNLGVAGNKTAWLQAMLQRLGQDPAAGDYLLPGDGDVWAFMESVVAWIRDPERAGMTAV